MWIFWLSIIYFVFIIKKIENYCYSFQSLAQLYSSSQDGSSYHPLQKTAIYNNLSENSVLTGLSDILEGKPSYKNEDSEKSSKKFSNEKQRSLKKNNKFSSIKHFNDNNSFENKNKYYNYSQRYNSIKTYPRSTTSHNSPELHKSKYFSKSSQNNDKSNLKISKRFNEFKTDAKQKYFSNNSYYKNQNFPYNRNENFISQNSDRNSIKYQNSKTIKGFKNYKFNNLQSDTKNQNFEIKFNKNSDKFPLINKQANYELQKYKQDRFTNRNKLFKKTDSFQKNLYRKKNSNKQENTYRYQNPYKQQQDYYRQDNFNKYKNSYKQPNSYIEDNRYKHQNSYRKQTNYRRKNDYNTNFNSKWRYKEDNLNTKDDKYLFPRLNQNKQNFKENKYISSKRLYGEDIKKPNLEISKKRKISKKSDTFGKEKDNYTKKNVSSKFSQSDFTNIISSSAFQKPSTKQSPSSSSTAKKEIFKRNSTAINFQDLTPKLFDENNNISFKDLGIQNNDLLKTVKELGIINPTNEQLILIPNLVKAIKNNQNTTCFENNENSTNDSNNSKKISNITQISSQIQLIDSISTSSLPNYTNSSNVKNDVFNNNFTANSDTVPSTVYSNNINKTNITNFQNQYEKMKNISLAENNDGIINLSYNNSINKHEVKNNLLKQEIAQALLLSGPAGTGKTLSYLLPIIDDLLINNNNKQKNKKIKALIIAPTRELAAQISRVCTLILKQLQNYANNRSNRYKKYNSFENEKQNNFENEDQDNFDYLDLENNLILSEEDEGSDKIDNEFKSSLKNGMNYEENVDNEITSGLLLGGSNIARQLRLFSKRSNVPTICVCTVGRLIDICLKSTSLRLKHVKYVVFDEYDELFDIESNQFSYINSLIHTLLHNYLKRSKINLEGQHSNKKEDASSKMHFLVNKNDENELNSEYSSSKHILIDKTYNSMSKQIENKTEEGKNVLKLNNNVEKQKKMDADILFKNDKGKLSKLSPKKPPLFVLTSATPLTMYLQNIRSNSSQNFDLPTQITTIKNKISANLVESSDVKNSENAYNKEKHLFSYNDTNYQEELNTLQSSFFNSSSFYQPNIQFPILKSLNVKLTSVDTGTQLRFNNSNNLSFNHNNLHTTPLNKDIQFSINSEKKTVSNKSYETRMMNTRPSIFIEPEIIYRDLETSEQEDKKSNEFVEDMNDKYNDTLETFNEPNNSILNTQSDVLTSQIDTSIHNENHTSNLLDNQLINDLSNEIQKDLKNANTTYNSLFNQKNNNIIHIGLHTDGRKMTIFKKFLSAEPFNKKIICFCNSQKTAEFVYNWLTSHTSLIVEKFSGYTLQKNRKTDILNIQKGNLDVLVTTELSARGLDLPFFTHVLNYDLPTDATHYMHRAGRIGRAGNIGVVCTLSSSDKSFIIENFVKKLNIPFNWVTIYEGKIWKTENNDSYVDAK